MGLVGYYVSVVLQVIPFLGGENGLLTQQPLPLNVPSSGVIIHPQIPEGFKGIDSPYKDASQNFVCRYPSLIGWESCNGPNDRGCWLRDAHIKQPVFSQFDIHTDYEKLWPTGITREYWLDVTEKTISPDGFPKDGQVFNNTYPGPLIEACWGDDIVVHVTDKLSDNGTTIHWHGVRQLHTNDADGVNGVTQCPIAENNTYTYRFKATQYGHSWYHSHYSLQYPNGVAGPLLIHGPNSADWDVAWDPIFVEDWIHENAFAAFPQELSPQVKGLPSTDSILLGGQGVFNGSGSIFTKVVQAGKKVLIRLVNSSTDMHFIVSIDGHKLQVISTDFVPIEPYVTDSLSIGIGQRYSIIVETDQPVGNYWIRTDPAPGCSGNATAVDERNGILRYQGAPTTLPTSTKHTDIPFACKDEPYASLVPVVRWEVGTTPANNVTDDTFEVGLVPSRGFNRWEIGRRPLWLNFSDPTLLSIENKTFNPDYDIYEFDFVNEWIYFVITGDNLTNIPTLPDKLFVPASHPIHMHGHDFAILGSNTEPYNETTDPLTFKYSNPPRRDVALLPSGGWLALAFRSDNPGVWLLHCHIAWHASSGLALQMLERKSEIWEKLGSQRITATERTCSGWDTWLKNGERIDQEDSGI